MLGLSDKRCLSRSLAAIGLVLGPLFFLLDTLIDPAWPDDDAAYLAGVAGHETRHAAGMVTFGLIGLTASFAYKAYWLTFFSAGTVLGLVLLAVALLRQGLVALWSPILLIVASVFWHVAGGERVTDEDWARWEVPLE
jgi:hypothetical protein